MALSAATMLLGSLAHLVVGLFRVSVRLLRIPVWLFEISPRLLSVSVWLFKVAMCLRSVPVWLLVTAALLLVLLLMLLVLLLLVLLPVVGAVVVVERGWLLRPAMIVVVAHGAFGSHGVWMSAVVVRVGTAIGTRRLKMLLLKGSCSDVLLVHCVQLFGGRIVPDSAGAAAECHAMFVHDRVVLHHGAIDIGVVDVNVVYVHNGCVVFKTMVVPPAADKADAHVTKSVVHAAVESDVGSPVSGMKDVNAARPAPVGRRP